MQQWKLLHMHKYNIWVFSQYITIFLIWIKKSWFWHFGSGLKRVSFCGSLISGLQEHPSGRQILWSLIFWCHNGFMIWFLIALSLCISIRGSCFPFFCRSGITLIFTTVVKTATLQSPAAPGESIPCWDHPLLAWVGDERNSERQKNVRRMKKKDYLRLRNTDRSHPCWARI